MKQFQSIPPTMNPQQPTAVSAVHAWEPVYTTINNIANTTTSDVVMCVRTMHNTLTLYLLTCSPLPCATLHSRLCAAWKGTATLCQGLLCRQMCCCFACWCALSLNLLPPYPPNIPRTMHNPRTMHTSLTMPLPLTCPSLSCAILPLTTAAWKGTATAWSSCPSSTSRCWCWEAAATRCATSPAAGATRPGA